MKTAAARWALITGAGSGMGRALAEQLSRQGVSLLLVGRRADALTETANGCPGETVLVPADVTSESDRQRIRSAASGRTIDYLVQLAGAMEFSSLVEFDRRMWERAFATHVHARLYLIQDLLPQLGDAARVLLAGSRSGTRPRRGAAAYCCSYAAALMLSECLRLELAESGVHLLSFLPGSVDSPLLQRSMGVSRELFPDGAIYAEEQARGELIPPAVVARWLSWLLLAAPPSVYDQGVLAIDDERFRADWSSWENSSAKLK